MEIIDATELEIAVLKEMAREWMKENILFLQTVKEYPSFVYKDNPRYDILLEGEQVYRAIQKLGRNNNDGNRSA